MCILQHILLQMPPLLNMFTASVNVYEQADHRNTHQLVLGLDSYTTAGQTKVFKNI